MNWNASDEVYLLELGCYMNRISGSIYGAGHLVNKNKEYIWFERNAVQFDLRAKSLLD
jgi:hypothetical protein